MTFLLFLACIVTTPGAAGETEGDGLAAWGASPPSFMPAEVGVAAYLARDNGTFGPGGGLRTGWRQFSLELRTIYCGSLSGDGFLAVRGGFRLVHVTAGVAAAYSVDRPLTFGPAGTVGVHVPFPGFAGDTGEASVALGAKVLIGADSAEWTVTGRSEFLHLAYGFGIVGEFDFSRDLISGASHEVITLGPTWGFRFDDGRPRRSSTTGGNEID